MPVKVIVEWLRQVEDLATSLYAEAAAYFSADEAFSACLSRLAAERGASPPSRAS